MKIRDFQKLMDNLYGPRDKKRGTECTFMWLVEEVGELSRSLRKSDGEKQIREEMADILAWLCSLANILDIDLQGAALEKYPLKCPRCGLNPCECRHRNNFSESQ